MDIPLSAFAVLYKVGPEAYHASYLVHILGFPSRPAPTWNELNSWVRLGGHVSKVSRRTISVVIMLKLYLFSPISSGICRTFYCVKFLFLQDLMLVHLNPN